MFLFIENMSAEAVAYAIGFIVTVLATLYTTLFGVKNSDKKSPEDRPITPHETKREIESLRIELKMAMNLITDALGRIEKSDDSLSEDHRELRRLLSELNIEIRHLSEK